MTSVCRDKYRYFACLLRDRFDKNKDVKDMVKATELLRAGEEEFWASQHPQPYVFADSPGGVAYERYEMYKVRGRQCWESPGACFVELGLGRAAAWASNRTALLAEHLIACVGGAAPALENGVS